MRIAEIAFDLVPSAAEWYASDQFGNPQACEERARAINVLQLASGRTEVCGLRPGDSQHRLYLVPTDDPLEIAKAFDVGIDRELEIDDQKECLARLKKVQRR